MASGTVKGRKIVSKSVTVSVTSAWGSFYQGQATIDISSLGLSAIPTKVLASFLPTTSNLAWIALSKISSPSSVVVYFFRPSSDTTTGVVTIEVLD